MVVGVFTADGAGTNIGDNADQFRFIYQTLDGDGEVVARVDSLERTRPVGQGGRDDPRRAHRGCKHASALVTASRGAMFQRRIANDAVTTQTDVDLTSAPVWLKIVRKGTPSRGSNRPTARAGSKLDREVVYLNRLATWDWS